MSSRRRTPAARALSVPPSSSPPHEAPRVRRYKVTTPIAGWPVAPGDVLVVHERGDCRRELAHYAAVDVHGHRDGYALQSAPEFATWAAFAHARAAGALVPMGRLALVADAPPRMPTDRRDCVTLYRGPTPRRAQEPRR